MSEHLGFKRAQAAIARRTNPRTGRPYGQERAGAILATASRNASAKARAQNPNLRRVGGT